MYTRSRLPVCQSTEIQATWDSISHKQTSGTRFHPKTHTDQPPPPPLTTTHTDCFSLRQHCCLKVEIRALLRVLIPLWDLSSKDCRWSERLSGTAQVCKKRGNGQDQWQWSKADQEAWYFGCQFEKMACKWSSSMCVCSIDVLTHSDWCWYLGGCRQAVRLSVGSDCWRTELYAGSVVRA